MTLYYFNPNDYGEEYFVMNKDKQSALNSLVLHLKKESEHPDNIKYDFIRKEYEEWAAATPEKLPKQYTIDEFSEGQVAEAYYG